MESKELRIGNYVKRFYWNPTPNGKKKEWQPCEVITLQLEHLLTTESIKHRKYIKTPYYQIKPIPLTEQWILDFGFEKDSEFGNWHLSEYKMYTFKSGSTTQMAIGQKDEAIFWYNYSSDDYYSSTKKIPYVHQLQNLYYALTGEELTIKNRD